MAVQPPKAPPSRPQPQGPTKRDALPLIELSVKLAKANRRADLVSRLAITLRRLSTPDIRVLVVGEYKQGKSSLVNALLGFRVCPVDDDVATSVPTTVRYAEKAVAHATRAPDDGQQERREEIPLDRVASLASEAGNPENRERLRSVEVGVPSELLKQGLTLVDTPGVGGIASAHNAATMTAMPFADAVLFVSDASQELTRPEIDFVQTARNLTPNIVSVLTKTDFYPEWRRILEIDREHLKRAGVVTGVVPLSSTLRLTALAAKDQRLNEESGFLQLISLLRDSVIARAEKLAVRSAAHDILSVLEQLDEPHAAAVKVLKDPEQGAEVVADLQRAKEQAEQLKASAARWQQTLNDGFQDLTADIDYELRMRLRDVTREADESIDQSDPTKIWSEWQAWLQRRVSREVADVYMMVSSRTQEVVRKVADHFEQAQPDVGAVARVETPAHVLEAVGGPTGPQKQKVAVFSQGLNVLRGAQGGMMMSGMIGNVAGLGLAMVNPFSVGLSVLLAGKSLVDERGRRVAVARQQAKQAHRKYTEEITLQVGKDSRDTLRRVQREVRDSFTGIANELQRSVGEAFQAAQAAVKTDQQQRAKQLQAADTQLKAIQALKAKAAALAPDLAQPQQQRA